MKSQTLTSHPTTGQQVNSQSLHRNNKTETLHREIFTILPTYIRGFARMPTKEWASVACPGTEATTGGMPMACFWDKTALLLPRSWWPSWCASSKLVTDFCAPDGHALAAGLSCLAAIATSRLAPVAARGELGRLGAVRAAAGRPRGRRRLRGGARRCASSLAEGCGVALYAEVSVGCPDGLSSSLQRRTAGMATRSGSRSRSGGACALAAPEGMLDSSEEEMAEGSEEAVRQQQGRRGLPLGLLAVRQQQGRGLRASQRYCRHVVCHGWTEEEEEDRGSLISKRIHGHFTGVTNGTRAFCRSPEYRWAK